MDATLANAKALLAINDHGQNVALFVAQNYARAYLAEHARAEAAEAERDRLAARVAELEAATAPLDHAELREQLADLEHQQWAHWTRHMLTRLGLLDESGGVRFLAARLMPGSRLVDLKRWESQCNTTYHNLSESEKNSDREWADRVLAIVKPAAPVEWREGVPSVADVRAHEERGGLWRYRKQVCVLRVEGDRVEVHRGHAVCEYEDLADEGRGLWSPFFVDARPAPWPVHPSETADDIDPIAMLEADAKFDRMGIVEVADAE